MFILSPVVSYFQCLSYLGSARGPAAQQASPTAVVAAAAAAAVG